ncbi:MAG TPA: antibiotic biosynthesis monooxygenase [Candidatus Polarisedimenticolia bacterium]|nr:antibiotic biosynthesis monooxygenase [Candidatus Polarisedimenticolia bacterium]
MIIELVSFRVKTDRIPDFERHNEEWVRLMRRARGYVTHSLMRSLDSPAEFTSEVRWVNRDYRDRFHAIDDAERRALHQNARDLFDGPPDSRLVETI